MNYRWKYNTPDGFDPLFMSSDGTHLTGLWFEHSSDMFKHSGIYEEKLVPVFEDTIRWLDAYFSGKDPGFTPALRILNATSFRTEVLDHLLEIPYGQTVSYGDIAKKLAASRGIPRMSAQAVGGAVGWNPIGIIIPCHRVIGADGSMTGYGGGLPNKIKLLQLEGILPS